MDNAISVVHSCPTPTPPAAFADRMAYMVRDYVDACTALGREPDEALLK
ncbi:MAG: hypothetical protein QHJ81_12380 [Anaerolineae bacterium]|nr:hypothetical protein [Anaerolineae bacterium]